MYKISVLEEFYVLYACRSQFCELMTTGSELDVE